MYVYLRYKNIFLQTSIHTYILFLFCALNHLSNRHRYGFLVGKLSRRLISERPAHTPGRQGAGVRRHHRDRPDHWVETIPRLCGHAIVGRVW